MEYLTLTNSTEIIRIASDDIVFIKGDGNYSDIYLSNGKAENVTYQLHGLMDKLEKFTYCPFHRVGKSLIVNKDYIFKVNPGLQKLILASSNLYDDIHIKASKEAPKCRPHQHQRISGQSGDERQGTGIGCFPSWLLRNGEWKHRAGNFEKRQGEGLCRGTGRQFLPPVYFGIRWSITSQVPTSRQGGAPCLGLYSRHDKLNYLS